MKSEALNFHICTGPLIRKDRVVAPNLLIGKILEKCINILKAHSNDIKSVSTDGISIGLKKNISNQEGLSVEHLDLPTESLNQLMSVEIGKRTNRSQKKSATSDSESQIADAGLPFTCISEKLISSTTTCNLNPFWKSEVRPIPTIFANRCSTIEVQGGFSVSDQQHFFLQVQNRNILIVFAANQTSRQWWFREHTALSLALKQAGYQKILYHRPSDDIAC